jgi:hypothetical protein
VWVEFIWCIGNASLVIAERTVFGLGGFENAGAIPLTPPGIEILDGRGLVPSKVLGRTTTL